MRTNSTLAIPAWDYDTEFLCASCFKVLPKSKRKTWWLQGPGDPDCEPLCPGCYEGRVQFSDAAQAALDRGDVSYFARAPSYDGESDPFADEEGAES